MFIKSNKKEEKEINTFGGLGEFANMAEQRHKTRRSARSRPSVWGIVVSIIRCDGRDRPNGDDHHHQDSGNDSNRRTKHPSRGSFPISCCVLPCSIVAMGFSRARFFTPFCTTQQAAVRPSHESVEAKALMVHMAPMMAMMMATLTHRSVPTALSRLGRRVISNYCPSLLGI